MTPAAVGRRLEARLIGWCRPLADAPLMRDIGLDFIEVALAPLGLENAESFAKAKRQVTWSALPTLAFNNFLPQNLRVVGPEADIPRFKVYLGTGGRTARAWRSPDRRLWLRFGPQRPGRLRAGAGGSRIHRVAQTIGRCAGRHRYDSCHRAAEQGGVEHRQQRRGRRALRRRP